MHRDDIRSTLGSFFISNPAQSCRYEPSRSEKVSTGVAYVETAWYRGFMSY